MFVGSGFKSEAQVSRFHELLDLYRHTVSVAIHLPVIPERNDKKGEFKRILMDNFTENIFPF